MKLILTTILAASAAVVSAQEPIPVAKPAETPTPVVQVVKESQPTTPVVENKEPLPKIEEPMAVCDLGLKHSPIVSGLQLRMPEAEAALKAHTAFEADPGESGRRRMSVKLDRDPILENVESASLTSRDARVNFIKLTYPKTYATVKDFISEFAPKLGISRIAFRVDREKNEAMMVCKEFTLQLKSGTSGSELTLVQKN